MTLYRRNHKVHLGAQTAGIRINSEGLSRLLADNPFSVHYVPPSVSANAKAVVAYWVSILRKQYGRNLELPRTAALSHAKRALQEHTSADVVRAIRAACFVSRYPFSIPFAIKQMYGEVEKQEPAKQLSLF